MKASAAYLFISLLATEVSADCVEGTREEISSDYIVQHKCDFRREGGSAIKGVGSAAECATLAKDAGADASTYHAGKKQCIIAKDDGKDASYTGAILLVKVEEDPFTSEPEEEVDPFGETCDEERDRLISELGKCHDDLKRASSKPKCGVSQWGVGYYSLMPGRPIAECKRLCDADEKCLSYSAAPSAAFNCYLYDKEIAEVIPATAHFPEMRHFDKRCG